MKIPIALIFFSLGGLTWNLHSNQDLKNQIVQLSLDKEEIKQHTDILAGIVKTQQYQIDVLAGMLQENQTN